MRTIIIDDESDAVDSLELIIEEFLPLLEVISTFTDAKKAIKKIPIIKPDLVFLDINMPGMNGFELLENLDIIDFSVIFTTAHDEYAIKAFRFGAANYLLKPIDIDDLIVAVNRIIDERDLKLKKTSLPSDEKIAISSIDGMHYINPAEIIFLEADLTHVYIHVKNKKPLQVKTSLKELENRLPKQFFRTHNSFIVNIHSIKKLIKADQWTLEMDNAAIIPVARRKRSEFMSVMKVITGKSIE